MFKWRGGAAVGLGALLLAACKTGGGDGCSKDSDCKGSRLCVSGACVDADKAASAEGSPAPGSRASVIDRALGAVRGGPQVIVDEQIAVSANGSQMRGFTLPADRRVLVSAEGVQHTGKGFMVYVMSDAELENFNKRETFRHLPGFHGLKVTSFSHAEKIPAGQWYAVVHNSENLWNTMTVHLKVVADPD